MIRNARSIAAWRRRLAATGAFVCALWPALAAATRQCPPQAGEKSPAFWALGWTILGAFALLGLAMPALALRRSRGRRALHRVLWALAALAPMLGCWLLGLWIFFARFVMVC